jgi:hypothetical protein
MLIRDTRFPNRVIQHLYYQFVMKIQNPEKKIVAFINILNFKNKIKGILLIHRVKQLMNK